MRAADGSRVRARHPSTLGLVGRQVVYQLRLLARSPMAAFATLVIPLMVLLAVNLLYSGVRLNSRGGIAFAQFFTPAMVAFALVNACYMSVIASTTLAREQGILKRIRSTPLPPWVYMMGRIISSGLVAAVGAVVVVAVGVGVYGFQVIWSGIPVALLELAVAMFCFCSLGLAVSVLVPSAEAAVPIAWGTMLPLCFVSGIFQPIDNAPHWLRAVASVFPLRPLADDLESAFNPVTGTRAIHAGHLELMALWGLAAAAFALLAFRFEPDGRRRRGGGPRRAALFATDRVRELLEPRGGRGPRGRRDRARPAITERHEARRSTRSGVETQTEWIEGPAPAEDSSVPPEPAAAPTRAGTGVEPR